MEYVIVTKNRLTKYGKIVFAIIIAVVLLVASILIFLSKEKIFQAKKNDNLKVAKKDRINRFGAIEYIVKEENKDIKSVFSEEKEASKEKLDIFIEDETQVNIDSKIDDGQNRIGTETLENEIDNQIQETQPETSKTVPKRNLEQFQGKQLVAFTFDDGPNSETTNKLLDNLDKYNARVTFFVVGNRINNNTDTLKRAYDMGNQIGSHSYSHRNFFKIDETKILEEVQNTNNVIKEVIGVEPTIIRPPYGNTNSDIKNIYNMYTILWNLDTEDWKSKDADKIVEYILNNVHDGAIILLHDIYDTSIDATLRAMEILEQEGYAFVTIDEMAQIKNVELDKNINYHYFYE